MHRLQDDDDVKVEQVAQCDLAGGYAVRGGDLVEDTVRENVVHPLDKRASRHVRQAQVGHDGRVLARHAGVLDARTDAALVAVGLRRINHAVARVERLRHVRFADLNGEPFLVLADIGFWMNVVRNHLPDSELLVQRDVIVFEQLLTHSLLLVFSTQVSRPRPSRVSIPLADVPAHATFFLSPGLHASAPARELYAAIARS